MKETNRDLEDYLALLEVDFDRPDFENLIKIVQQNLSKIPFENISKLYYKKHFGMVYLPDLSRFVKGNKQNNFGGICFSNNYFLFQLLEYLGYNVKLCGADMDKVNAHLAIVVQLEGDDYLVDVGFAAPFLKPILLDGQSNQEISFGMDRYVISPKDKMQGTQLTMYRRNRLRGGYYLKPGRAKIEDFHVRILESFSPGSAFLNSLLLSKFVSGEFICIYNFKVITSTENDFFIEIILSIKELIGLIEEKFGIPAYISTNALKEIRSFSDARDVKFGRKSE
ncbi:MAG: arylamine N-acetyltransferase [Bacteroidales bacterium]|nr:arylamine N-acetyltransferase [Bacteroidales bacterium]MCF8458439.1 arylamine N-acetyltransferase [Bacteroidales bacterium]